MHTRFHVIVDMLRQSHRSINRSINRGVLVLGISSIIVLVGCSGTDFTIDLSPIQNGNAPEIRTATQFDEWTTIKTGIDIKQQLMEGNTTAQATTELFTMVRFDPTINPMRVAVDSAHPKTVSEWQTELGASVVINGSYFDEDYNLTTQAITNGETYGYRLTGKTAFLQTSDGLHWDILSAKQATDSFSSPAAVSIQTYPLLIQNGTPLVTDSSEDQSPRTIVALDTAGQMYFIIAEYGVLTLRELDEILVNTLDSDLDSAINLDGGTSTGLVVSGDNEYVNESILLPAVLYVE